MVFRSDRNYLASGRSRGGGVLLAAKSVFNATTINLDNQGIVASPLIDMVGVKVVINDKSLICVVVYIPPKLPADQFVNLFEFFCTLYVSYGDQLLILGDFNLPHSSTLMFDQRSSNSAMLAFNNFLNLSNFKQSNNCLNSQDKLLDLVLCGCSCSVTNSSDVLIPEDILHPALDITLHFYRSDLSGKKLGKQASHKFNFRKANLLQLGKLISAYDWSPLINISDVDVACCVFYKMLNDIFALSVPETNSKRHGDFPAWFNNDIIKQIKLKFKYFRRYKKFGLESDNIIFKQLRKTTKSKISQCYYSHVQELEQNLRLNPSNFYAFLNHKKVNSGVPKKMTYNSFDLCDPCDVVNAFADNFSKGFIPSGKLDYSTIPPSSVKSLLLSSINESEVLCNLLKIKSNFTSGPDHIPGFILHDYAEFLAFPLTVIFNLCLNKSTFPSSWKLSRVCPVFKKGARSDVINYRPIAIISNFSKVFELLLSTVISHHVKHMLSIRQHGFMRGRSTATNLITISQAISESIDNHSQLDVIYTDFSKAFDRLDHGILLRKLDSFGFSVDLVMLFESYLVGRRQFVSLNGFNSVVFPTSSGVPQGTVLGPLLFNLFIDDIFKVITVSCLGYADDLKIYHQVTNFQDCQLLQSNLSSLDQWCLMNKLYLNVDKCLVMSFTKKTKPIVYKYCISGFPLDRPLFVKDLGVTFDSKLSFNMHINNITSNAYKMLGFLMRCSSDFRRNETFKVIFESYVRSKLEYCSIVWCPNYAVSINKIERILRLFLKFLTFKRTSVYPPVGYPQDDLLRFHNVLSLKRRRHLASVIFAYKLFNNFLNCPEILSLFNFSVPRFSSRSSNMLHIPYAKTNVLQHSPLVNICRNVNLLGVDLFNCSISMLKALPFYATNSVD